MSAIVPRHRAAFAFVELLVVITIAEEQGATFWAYPACFATSDVNPNTPTLSIHDYPDCISNVPSHKLRAQGWASYHPGGLNGLLCDGAVKFLSTTIDGQLLGQLASIADGQAVRIP